MKSRDYLNLIILPLGVEVFRSLLYSRLPLGLRFKWLVGAYTCQLCVNGVIDTRRYRVRHTFRLGIWAWGYVHTFAWILLQCAKMTRFSLLLQTNYGANELNRSLWLEVELALFLTILRQKSVFSLLAKKKKQIKSEFVK